MNEAVIIGYGVTGKATAYALGISDHIDSSGIPDNIFLVNYRYLILCLPTPTIGGKQDLEAIEGWLEIVQKLPTNPIVIIRSTILPGTCDKLSKKYGLRIAHVPEFLTEVTAIWDASNPELLVIGADDILVKQKVKDLFVSKTNYKKLILCSATTAELIKYTMNSFFALKVILGNQLWDVVKETKADYGKITEALEHHKWGAKNGWDVWQGGFRGYGGKCLPKDIEAFVYAFDLPLLSKMQEINKKLVKETK